MTADRSDTEPAFCEKCSATGDRVFLSFIISLGEFTEECSDCQVSPTPTVTVAATMLSEVIQKTSQGVEIHNLPGC